MNAKLLIEIIHRIEEFEDENSGKTLQNIEDFRLYLNEKSYQKLSPKNLSEKHNLVVFELENEIAKQVILLGRYSKHLIKKSMENIPELSNEDFTYLFRMMDENELTKMQLIERNAHEKQTGIEIIKRLINNGLLEEKSSHEDKRSKLVSVTQKGKKIFHQAMNQITMVSKIMCGKLSEEEKENLLLYLKKLNTFHHLVYTQMREESLGKINEIF